MKKIISALILAIISLLLLPLHQNQVPDFEDIASFDPSHYDFTYSLQEFKLKTHDRQWTLSSVTGYSAEGEMQWERIYHLDVGGQSYYMNNGERQDVSRYPRRGWKNITGYISDWNLAEETLDDTGRVIYRMGEDPSFVGSHEIANWYYCPNTDTAEDANISIFTRTMHEVSPDGMEPVCYGANDEPIMEFNTYEITNYDCHGNETRIWIEGKCFLKTDANGYLQMIVQDNPGTYSVLRVDDSGKPLWTAVYHKETLSLMEYSVCCYQEIDG